MEVHGWLGQKCEVTPLSRDRATWGKRGGDSGRGSRGYLKGGGGAGGIAFGIEDNLRLPCKKASPRPIRKRIDAALAIDPARQLTKKRNLTAIYEQKNKKK